MRRLILLILALMLALTACGTVDKNQQGENGFTSDVEVLPDYPDVEEKNDEDNLPENNLPNDNNTEGDEIEAPPEENNPDDSKDEHQHGYIANVTNPTCENSGFTTWVCSCGDSYIADYVDSIGHQYDAIVTKPTCVDDGYTTYTCTKCNEVNVSSIISASGHNYSANISKPTCESDGYTTYTCSSCQDSYISDKLNATGHNYNSEIVSPTCNTPGYTIYTCLSCSNSYIGDKTTALGHSYSAVVTAPTCEAGGFTTYSCTVCNSSYNGNKTNALGHSYSSVVTNPTCTASGYSTFTCTVCTHSYVGNETLSTGHNYLSVVTSATCTENGYTTYTCSACSDSYTANIVVAVGHAWKEATTEAPKTCTSCGVTEGEKLPGSASGYGQTLYVNYINVGQGDSILIKVGDCDILIDAGYENYGTTVSDYLKNKGVDDIELMINTHPDADHCGGLTTVLNDFVVEQVWASSFTKTTTAYTSFKNAVKNEGLSLKTPSVGTVYTYEYLTITVLYSGAGAESSNDASIVVMLQYGSFKFLFTGDISTTIEDKLVSDSSIDLSCDVLKVGHHGSAGSSSAAFLSETGARYGVICVGSNSYGHPTSAALGRLSSAGISVYRTDQNGNIVFSTDGTTMTIPGGSSVSGGSGASSGSSSSGGASSTTQYFIGNTETKVFHLPTCSNLPAASKQNTMYNYSWIINIAGYTPCGKCLKDYVDSSSGTSYIANSESKVYHLATCSYLPAASKQVVIYSTTGYTPCGHCIKTSTSYIANSETKVFHLSTCSYLPASSKQIVIYDTTGYTACGHCLK